MPAKVDGHALIDISWVTTKGVWGAGEFKPVREPIDHPYSRWYCDCGSIGRKYHGEKTEAMAAARRGHAAHAKAWAGEEQSNAE